MKVINIMVGCYWKTRKQDFIGDITPFCLNIQEKLHSSISIFRFSSTTAACSLEKLGFEALKIFDYYLCASEQYLNVVSNQTFSALLNLFFEICQ